jgi:hypothetical protein
MPKVVSGVGLFFDALKRALGLHHHGVEVAAASCIC